MTQQEVYNLLKKYRNKWLTTKEIAKLQNTSFNTVGSNLKRLRSGGVIMCKTVVRAVKTNGESRQVYVYRYKR